MSGNQEKRLHEAARKSESPETENPLIVMI